MPRSTISRIRSCMGLCRGRGASLVFHPRLLRPRVVQCCAVTPGCGLLTGASAASFFARGRGSAVLGPDEAQLGSADSRTLRQVTSQGPRN